MDSVEVVKVALPPDRVPVAKVVLPSLKVTVPVGVPLALPWLLNCGVTVAVKVTDRVEFDGFNDEVTLVVVVA
jgi:hypothetical protein